VGQDDGRHAERMAAVPRVGQVVQVAPDDERTPAGHLLSQQLGGLSRDPGRRHFRRVVRHRHLDVPGAVPLEQQVEARIVRAGDEAVERHRRAGEDLAHPHTPF
jgi:hypothetical protein